MGIFLFPQGGIMTLDELCQKYHLSASTVTTKFKRTKDNIYKKYGVVIVKEGRGKEALYREVITDDNRAETIFKALEPVHNTGILKKDLNLPNFTFCVFMGVITTPMLVFRGRHEDFLKYIEISINENNILLLKDSIKELENAKIIQCMYDNSTDEEIITISLVRSAEVEMKIGIGMVRICKELADKNRKKDWIPLLKMWLGTELLSKNNTYTRQELMDMTGLSKYQIDDCGRILKENNIYKSTRAYAGYSRCIGINADMNAEDFYLIKSV